MGGSDLIVIGLPLLTSKMLLVMLDCGEPDFCNLVAAIYELDDSIAVCEQQEFCNMYCIHVKPLHGDMYYVMHVIPSYCYEMDIFG